MKKEKILLLTYLTLRCFLIVIATYILGRIIFFDKFYIPSNSMNPSLYSGDIIIVNKTLFGPRIYTKYNFSNKEYRLSCFRILGIRDIKYNDIIIFNRSKHKNKVNFIINNLMCKRCIGLPGDTISIKNGIYKNNNTKRCIGNQNMQYLLSLTPDSLISRNALRAFPKEKHFNWTIKDFGPLYIPRCGDIININAYSGEIYKQIIEYELDRSIKINWAHNIVKVGKNILKKYEFKHSYYFMAGDNVFDSDDSRYQGLIPDDFIIGIATRVIFSENTTTKKIRWERLGKKI